MMKLHLESTQSLDIVPMLGNVASDKEGPIWAPNWFSQETSINPRRLRHFTPRTCPQMHERFHDSEFKYYSRAADWPEWGADGKIKAGFTFFSDSKMLRARGCLLGTIQNFSTTVSWDSAPVNTDHLAIEQPFKSDSTAIFNPLYFLLTFTFAAEINGGTMDAISVRTDARSDFDDRLMLINQFLRMQASSTTRAALLSRSSLLHNWLSRNSSLDIFGRSLATIIRNRAGSFSIFQLLSPIVMPVVPPLIAKTAEPYLRGWQHGLPTGRYKRIERILGLGMNLACGTFGMGWVDDKARPRDQIAILKGCSVPVVLRARDSGSWTVVGDAIVHRAMFGEKMDEAKCEFLDLYYNLFRLTIFQRRYPFQTTPRFIPIISHYVRKLKLASKRLEPFSAYDRGVFIPERSL